MLRNFLFCFSMLIGTQFAFAETNLPSIPADDEPLPDAMQHVEEAPEVNFANLRDPFASYLEVVAQRGRALLDDQRLRLENREREKLENFDLTALKLVGVYTMGEDRVAMVQDSMGVGHTVRRGNYMGKNNGRVEKIDFNTLYLVEQVMSPAGEIVDNQVTMTLEEINN